MSKVSEERERSSIDRDLSSSDDELRRLAVERLLELPLASAIPRLVESLGDSSWRVRKASVQRIVACSESSEVVGALLVFDPVEGFGQEAVRWVNGQPVSLGWPLHSYAKSISGDGGTQPRWSADGRELFYRTASGIMVVAVEADADVFSFGPAEELFTGAFRFMPLVDGEMYEDYDVAPDGQRFVMFSRSEDDEGRKDHVTLVFNWLEELERLVPVN